jgi:hypothetical protein
VPLLFIAGNGVHADLLGVEAMLDELDAVMADGEFAWCFYSTCAYSCCCDLATLPRMYLTEHAQYWGACRCVSHFALPSSAL